MKTILSVGAGAALFATGFVVRDSSVRADLHSVSSCEVSSSGKLRIINDMGHGFYRHAEGYFVAEKCLMQAPSGEAQDIDCR